MNLRISTALLALSGALAPSMARASGQLPPWTIDDRKTASFAACRVILDTAWRKDLNRADPKPVPVEGGDRQTLITTKGVIDIDRRHADYEVEEGRRFRRLLPDTGQIRTDYRYERRHYTCNGRRLIGTSTSGYALEGYAPMPDAGASK